MNFDGYKHLNDDGDGITIGIEEIAPVVEKLNYGMHRMLCALVRARLKRRPGDEMALAIRALIEKGLY